MSYVVEYVNEDTLGQVAGLLKRVFGNSYYGADDKFLRWFYFDSPYKTQITKADEYSILVFIFN